ncbi:MAG: PorT family protein [Chitinophagaceae bacterium]|nr:PorT family protein [Chitinophagaceae bacterium]
MKAFFYAMILCSSSVLHLQAQKMEQDEERFFRFGIIGGVNLNSVDGRSFKNEYNFNYQLGGFILINPLTKIGFQPEVHFAQQTATYSKDLTEIYDDLTLGGDQAKARLNTLRFTGLVNFDIGPSQRVKLQLGPQYAIVMNETTGVQGAAKDIFKKGDFSGVAGIWLQLPVVFIGARYNHGFTNLNDIVVSNPVGHTLIFGGDKAGNNINEHENKKPPVAKNT